MSDRRFRVRGLVVAAASIAFALSVPVEAALAAPVVTLEPGTYQQIDPVTKKVLDPGNQIVFVRGKSGRLSFSVNAIRALDLNQGFVAGTLPANGASVTWSQKVADANCRITFAARAGGLTVVQDDKFGDCGFGYGAVADGTYRRTSSGGKLGAPNGP